MSSQLVTIPNFLAAGSPSGLRRLMILNNIKRSTWYKYFDIQLNPKDGKWYAWYLQTVTDQELLNEAVESKYEKVEGKE